jgi:hypothetical protein
MSLVSQAHVHRFVNVLLHSDRARSTSQRLLYRGVRSEGYRVLSCRVGLRWDSGTSTCSGTWGAIACGPSPESLVSSAAKRFDTTSGDVDVSTFAVLRLSPGLKAIQDT